MVGPNHYIHEPFYPVKMKYFVNQKIVLFLDPHDPGGISYHRDVVHQEIHHWCKFGESITLIPKILPFFTKWDGITDRRTIQTLHGPDISDRGHTNYLI